MEASSLDSQGSNVTLDAIFQGRVQLIGLGEVSINLCNLGYNLNKNSTASYSPKETKQQIFSFLPLLDCWAGTSFSTYWPEFFPILTHPELITR